MGRRLLALLLVAAALPALGQDDSAAMPAHHHHEGMAMAMTGLLGPYVATRESSGTSWQPDSTPHEGWHFTDGDWQIMAHGMLDAVYDHQGGRRGGDMSFVAGMTMLMAQRPIGNDATFGLRAMASPDPLMGPAGYPLLLATGETANGRDPLIDRQHPHNLIMELAGTYSQTLGGGRALFVYAGLPGEPALGPPAFMHRLSGMDNPEAPITHHWLDSTHISNGVVTAGLIWGDWKLEGSAFNGREPDQRRYQINQPNIDSASGRISFNPDRDLSLQASYGYLNSPEQLAPAISERRLTVSALYNLAFDNNDWATTLAWGRKDIEAGHSLDGFLLESVLVLDHRHSIFARLERANEDELLPTGLVQIADRLSLGYIRDFALSEHQTLGIGGLVSRYHLDRALENAYGTPTSWMLFLRVKLT